LVRRAERDCIVYLRLALTKMAGNRTRKSDPSEHHLSEPEKLYTKMDT
jgi:hypothetical protein